METSAVPDGVWGEHGRRVRFLRRVALFQGSSPSVLAHVATALKPRTVPAGHPVCRQGEPGTEFFIIESGTLVVSSDIGGTRRELARLGAGEWFGEMALLHEGARTATVVAETPARLWSLFVDDFRELLEREPAVAAAVHAAAVRHGEADEMRAFEVEHRNLAALMQRHERVRIGRNPESEIVLTSRLVSWDHAVIEQVDGTYRLRDLDSATGTFVNGAETRTVELRDGDEVWVADQRFVFDRREIQQVIEARGLRVDVTHVSKAVKGGKKLLHDVSLSALPGELVAIVGASGSGKTTLMDAISGLRPATGGTVLYNARDYYANMPLYRNVLGYVPQDDILHTQLPLRVTLQHAARLRLPADTSREDRDAAVDEALDELSLTPHADVRVKTLSGGQRKRCSIGVELLTKPRIFFLDEPTSGLDPATDAQMMRLMRRLAEDGSTVILTTHATKNVMLCDKIVFLAPGGHLAFVGSPQRALEYFEAEAFDEIYDRLATEATPAEWAERFRASPDYTQLLADQPAPAASAATGAERLSLGGTTRLGGLRRQIRQLGVLTRRTFDVYVRNPADLVPIVMQPVVLALLLIALFRSGLFGTGAPNPTAPMQLLFLLTNTAFLFGLLFSVQEIVKEFPIFRRERMVNLGIVPYLLSKAAFLGPVLVLMMVMMIAILRAANRLPAAGLDVYGRLLLTLIVTALAGMTAALLTSAAVKTSQQATDLLSLWIFPQTLFAGALFAVSGMNVVGRAISAITVGRWSFEAAGRVLDLNELFASSPSPIGRSLRLQYSANFSGSEAPLLGLLAAFVVLPLALTGIVLRARTATR